MQQSPYEMVSKGLQNSYNSVKQSREQSALDDILAQAMSSNNPDVLQNTLGQILSKVAPDKQQAAFGIVQGKINTIKQGQEKEKKSSAYQGLGLGENSQYLPDGIVTEQLKQKNKQNSLDRVFGNQQTNQNPLNGQNPQVSQAPQLSQNPESPAQPVLNKPNGNNIPKQRSFDDLDENELVKLTGSEYREISEPAKARLKQIQKDRENSKSLFESEGDKLEAKRVSEFAESVEKEYEAAKNENMRLRRMKELDKEGKVSTPALVKLLDAFGLPIGVISNPATEEFRKIEADFVRDVSKIFPGGKITNYEISSYMKTIPSLMNSEEGRAKIARNRELVNEAKEVRYNEYKKIIKENNGKKPANLSILLEERTAEKIAKIEDEFIKGVKEEVDKFQTPLRMIGPKGEDLRIPPDKIEEAQKAGAKFI